jgi:hypothetical protein
MLCSDRALHAAHPCDAPSWRDRWVAVLYAYFDESGWHSTASVFTLAGYVGTEVGWQRFALGWRAVLKEAGVSYFRMSEFESRIGQFKDWSNERRIAFLRQLASVIEGATVCGVGTSIIRADFKRVIVPELQPRSMDDIYREPYIFALHSCMETLVRLVEPQLARIGGLGLRFELNPEIQVPATKHASLLVRLRRWKHVVKSIEYVSPEMHVELQAADFLAYEANKHIENTVVKRDRAERRSFTRLVANKNLDLSYCDRESLQHGLETLRGSKRRPDTVH